MTKKKILLMVLIVCFSCIIIAGGVICYMNLFGKFAGIKNETLNSYSCSSDGDMNGGHDNVKVNRYNDNKAIITFSTAEYYDQNSIITEYLVDDQILDDIKYIFCKYNMQHWHQKKFTNLFIADGASTSYCFGFDDKYVYFSSQVYPENYSNKLDEIDDVINKHINPNALIPGLRLTDMSIEEQQKTRYPDDGQIHLEVFEYSERCIDFRISNGTDVDVDIDEDILLYKGDESIPFSKYETGRYDSTVWSYGYDEDSLKLAELLTEGEYTLKIGEYETVFTIGNND